MKQKFEFIKPEMLLHAAGNNHATFVHLLKTFLRIGPDMLKGVQDAFLQKDAIKLNYQVHSLKNCLSLLGAHEQSQALAMLESQSRKSDFGFDPASFDPVAQQIQTIIHEVADCLAQTEK